MRSPLPIGYVNWNQIFITIGATQMITFKIIASTSETTELKTRRHEKTYTVHECCQSDRIGYVSQLVQTFNLEGTLIKSGQKIMSFYFGFPNTCQAEKFEDFAKYKFPLLGAFETHCTSRLSKRLKSPFEVKIRNLEEIDLDLMNFFSSCIDKELAAPKVVAITLSEVKKRLSRL